MGSIFKAFANSRKFSFEAFARTEEEALAALTEGLESHGRQYGLEPRWWEGHLDLEVADYEVGRAYRDRAALPVQGRAADEISGEEVARASVTTEHFKFEAYGRTPAAAVRALNEGLRVHGARCEPPLRRDWWRAHYDVNLNEFRLGVGYRDRLPLPAAVEPGSERSGPSP
jgi:hypothetical protein